MPEEEVQTEATEEKIEAPKVEDAAPFDWRSGLPDDIREDPSLQTIRGTNEQEIIAALSKQHINSQRAMGLDKIALPGKNAANEEIREFYTKIGCPETVDGYTAPTEGISDGFDTNLFDGAREEAYRLGVTTDQLAGLARYMDTKQSEAREQSAEALVERQDKWEHEIEQEHGEAFAQNKALAQSVLSKFGSDELTALLQEGGLGSNPAMFNFMAKVGIALGQDEILGLGGTHQFASTPDQATDEWNRLKLDTKFMEAYFDKNNSGHQGAFDQAQKLFAQGAIA